MQAQALGPVDMRTELLMEVTSNEIGFSCPHTLREWGCSTLLFYYDCLVSLILLRETLLDSLSCQQYLLQILDTLLEGCKFLG